MKDLCHTINSFKETIFSTITRRAIETDSINLAQGFPDFAGPSWIVDLAKEAMDEGKNQYCASIGIKPLRESIHNLYKNFYNLDFSADECITVTNGATQGIFLAIKAVVNPGDEVITFEPFYDSYVGSILLAGGIPVPVTLKGPGFDFNINELEKAFSDKTKLIIINTPHNPSGKIFNTEEYQQIAILVEKYDSYILSDEVYEFLTFEGQRHIPVASHPKLKKRTITVSSAGKTFEFTGWKIGWTVAPLEITHAIRMIQQFQVFCVAHPLQVAMGKAISRLDSYLPDFRNRYQEKRNFFIKGLQEAGFSPIIPNGTYFVLVPIREFTDKDDFSYCMELIEKKKVASIPPSSFYLKSDEGRNYLRFCFAKKMETLKKACERLK
jgi:N-succinyldiaminopimelate aminotransferase